MTRLTPITGTVKDYAWGAPGGISAILGQPPTAQPEAELWLGAHHGAPSRPTAASTPWKDLAAWEQSSGQRLPFLLKLLAVGAPLSVQAHPGPEQGRAGFAAEESSGLSCADPSRNYRDPHGKPELLVAIRDGFDGLCGFRPIEESLTLLDLLAARTGEPAFRQWRGLLGDASEEKAAVRAAVTWLLSDDPRVEDLVAALDGADLSDLAEGDLVGRLRQQHPADPGIALALMLNRVTLRAGEALWLPPGQIHCYLSGLGVELMGPSDTVLRGGLTTKHVDVPQLLAVLDFAPGPAARLAPIPLAAHASAYQPRSVPSGADAPFELVHVTGDARIETGAASIALVLQGDFEVTVDGGSQRLRRGESCFADASAPWSVRGSGSLYLATADARRSSR